MRALDRLVYITLLCACAFSNVLLICTTDLFVNGELAAEFHGTSTFQHLTHLILSIFPAFFIYLFLFDLHSHCTRHDK